jgi:hypothetical protein
MGRAGWHRRNHQSRNGKGLPHVPFQGQFAVFRTPDVRYSVLTDFGFSLLLQALGRFDGFSDKKIEFRYNGNGHVTNYPRHE